MIIAGDPSGDLHGAGVVRELKKRIPSVDVYGVGGDRMKQEGMEILVHSSLLSFMGFAEVLKNLRLIRSVEKRLGRVLDERKPDVLVLIDYPGFNLRFAKRAKRQGVKTLYYISPQVWAWRKGRVKSMRGSVDRMKVVFPFEVEMYRHEGIDVEFVGHPLVDALKSSRSRAEFFASHGFNPGRRLLGLFPGSRRQEIERILPSMVKAAALLQRSHDIQVGLGVAPNLGTAYVRHFVPPSSQITLCENETYDLMQHADAALVTSGTATLETGWFGTPMVVVYKTSPLTFLIGRMLVDVQNIALVNIVAGKTIVPEFVQAGMHPRALAEAAGRFFDDAAYAQSVRSELAVIRTKLGRPGAAARVAEGIIALAEAA
jgi:lipid-A-disaccharide synthase